MTQRPRYLTILVGATMIAAGAALAANSPRERLSLDLGWKFHLGDEWGTGEKLDKAGVSAGPAKPSISPDRRGLIPDTDAQMLPACISEWRTHSKQIPPAARRSQRFTRAGLVNQRL